MCAIHTIVVQHYLKGIVKIRFRNKYYQNFRELNSQPIGKEWISQSLYYHFLLHKYLFLKFEIFEYLNKEVRPIYIYIYIYINIFIPIVNGE
jgi:hypothetical protein